MRKFIEASCWCILLLPFTCFAQLQPELFPGTGKIEPGDGGTVVALNNGEYRDMAVTILRAGTKKVTIRMLADKLWIAPQIVVNGRTFYVPYQTDPSPDYRTISIEAPFLEGTQTIRLRNGNTPTLRVNWIDVEGISVADTPPTADAGADTTIEFPNRTFTLMGKSTGTGVKGKWELLPQTFEGDNHLITTYDSAVYTYRYTVTDSKGRTAFDDKKVVLKWSPLEPLAQLKLTGADGQAINITITNDKQTGFGF